MPTRILASLIARPLYSGAMDIRNIVILTGAGVSAESGLATFRGPDGLWEGHRVEDVATPEAFRRDPALVHAFYDARRARLGDGRAQCRARGAGAARRRMAGRAAAGHPECRRPARARRIEAAGPHARRADQRLVPGVRRAFRVGWADGRGRGLSVMPRKRASPARHRVVRRNALRHGADRGRGPALRPVRVDRHVGRGLSRRRLRPDRALLRRADAGNEPGAQPGQHAVRRKPDREGGRSGAGVGGRGARASQPTPARSRGRARGPRPIWG